ncbi:UvrD-helicase domain-containing protein [Aquicella siphonis]|nr:UvrD-helicase domain-containing protein [Aquicella siphonis]
MNLIEQDQLHRARALNARESFIVQAPAGSGKTELLIQRLLTLLAHVNMPEEILAITFTKKAANEMRLRVIKALKQALHDPEPAAAHGKKTWSLARQVLQRDQALGWDLIANPNQLRIQTIDSLCSYLTRQLPLLSHFGSQPDIADNPAALYRETVREILTHVEENYDWSNAITQLLLHLDNDLNKLHDLLVSLLAKRDQWLSYVQLGSDETEIRQELERQLGLVITDALINVQDRFPQSAVNELLAIARFAASHVIQSDPALELSACLDLKQMPGTTPSDKLVWTGLARLLLTKSYSWRKRVDEDIGFPAIKSLKNPAEIALHQDYRQRLVKLIASLQDNENLRLALCELFYLPEPHYTQSQWEILQSLLLVLKIVAAQLHLTFQQHGQIDFIENTQAALTALGNENQATDLALSLDYQIKHILVDEFQDTSYTQYQLIEKLTAGWETDDGRTLFVVGDPMQSIYRFREAEVGLFIRMRTRGLSHIRLTPLTLTVNFRSAPQIVEWNNLHFQTIFPPFNDMSTGAVTYSASVSHHSGSSAASDTQIIVRGFADSPDQSEAEQITEWIRDLNHRFPGESIAILVRSRPHLTAIIPALKKAGVSFRAVDIDPLASRQHIQDVLSLTCAMLHPADRIAWLAVLRAPWCGLSLADLHVLAGTDPSAAICTRLNMRDVLEKLSKDGFQRVERVYPILKANISERERFDLRSWLESTWLALGGPACLQSSADIEDIHAYFRLLEEVGRKNQMLNLDLLKETISQLYASTQHDHTNVQIMTIHTAKGLEFDSVILPQLDRKNPNDDRPLLSWMERPLNNDQFALLLAPIHATGDEKDSIYEYINRQQKIKSDYETDRLFYVAATRAKKRLFLTFNTTRKNNHDYKVEAGSFLEKIWPYFDRRKEEIIVSDEASHTESSQAGPARRPVMKIRSGWTNPCNESLPRPAPAHQQKNGFHLIDNTSKIIGTVTHRILQRISLAGLAWWTRLTHAEQITFLKYHLQQQGMHITKMDDAVNMVKLALDHATADERGKWILKSHREARSEFALTAKINGEIEKFVIDRTFVDDDDTLWIIDYKTAVPAKHDLEDFLAREQAKYQEKMHAYALALRLSTDRCIKLGLYFPALPAWREWEPGI